MTTFDPKQYLRKLGKGDYLEVKWRLVWLRLEHPDAIIRTKLERLETDGPKPIAVFSAYCAFRHYFTDGDGEQLLDSAGRPMFELAEATGWGQEEPKDFGDYLEKAETKAVGRALAALGYGTQFSEDWDEEVQIGAGDTAKNVVDSPVERGGNARSGSTAASNRQNNRGNARPAVQTLNGVQFTVEEIERNGRKVQTYKSVETCPTHAGKHYYATLTEGNQLSDWAHGDGKHADGSPRRCVRAG